MPERLIFIPAYLTHSSIILTGDSIITWIREKCKEMPKSLRNKPDTSSAELHMHVMYQEMSFTHFCFCTFLKVELSNINNKHRLLFVILPLVPTKGKQLHVLFFLITKINPIKKIKNYKNLSIFLPQNKHKTSTFS